ncbi:unannotated protein [freshwater metagenome]|uniref:Unannotated protein n=1 Tax=freshwater metagenome TaxID=449393 RepID=A0A6J7RE25_9ZZZZ
MIEHLVPLYQVSYATGQQNPVALGKQSNLDGWGYFVVVFVDQIAHHRGVTFWVAEFVTATVRYDTGTVVPEC